MCLPDCMTSRTSSAAFALDRALSHSSSSISTRCQDGQLGLTSIRNFCSKRVTLGATVRSSRVPRKWLCTAVLSRTGFQDVLGNKNVVFQPLESPLPTMLPRRSYSTPLRPNHVPIYVMLPLDTVTIVNTLNHVKALQAGLRALKSIGVDGVMVDVWWGIVEAEGPRNYNWSAYLALVKMVNAVGLKLQAVMSFHGCGGNVGDSFLVSLPYWVLQEAQHNPDVLYTDKSGNRNGEYLSLGVDCLQLFDGRSPLQIYRDFMESFRDTFSEFLEDTISEVTVGLGPAGELRYPSYPEGDGRWRFPGIGEFQCYDKYMLANLKACATAIGKPDWGLGGPHNSGSYKQWPEETGFFSQRGSWNTPYGDFFLTWYSQSLIAHGDRVLSAAVSVFRGTGVVVAGKLAGIHWWYQSRSHAAELTAGYYNTLDRDGYSPIVQMFARHGALLNFTCVEMGDGEQPREAKCSPEGLLMQVRKACSWHGVPISGENALLRFDHTMYRRIKRNVYRLDSPELDRMASFTFLRLGESLFQKENWRRFTNFVQRMDDMDAEEESVKVMIGERDWARLQVAHPAGRSQHQKQNSQVLQMQL